MFQAQRCIRSQAARNNYLKVSGNAIYQSEGALYNWAAANLVAPTGWHLPSDPELYTLENYLKDNGQSCNASRSGAWDCSTAGTKLKSGGSSGFNGLLSGDRDADGSFYYRASYAGLWSSSPSGGSAWYRNLGSGNTSVARNAISKAFGFSVRLLSDTPASQPEGTVGSFTDPRDGQVYSTIVIGTQVWMSQNFRYLGNGIQLVPSSVGDATIPYSYIYNYTPG